MSAASGPAAGGEPPRARFFAGELPLWRTSAFTGEFGDVALIVSELEGGAVGTTSSTFVKVLARALYQPRLLPGWSEELLARARGKLLPLFTSAERTASALLGENPCTMDALLAEVGRLVGAIRDLAPGASVGIPCGWRTSKGGHVAFLSIENVAATAPGVPATTSTAAAEVASTRVVVLSNAGPGLQYHPVDHGSTYPTSRFQASIRFAGVPTSRIADESFLFMLLQCASCPRDSNSAAVL